MCTGLHHVPVLLRTWRHQDRTAIMFWNLAISASGKHPSMKISDTRLSELSTFQFRSFEAEMVSNGLRLELPGIRPIDHLRDSGRSRLPTGSW